MKLTLKSTLLLLTALLLTLLPRAILAESLPLEDGSGNTLLPYRMEADQNTVYIYTGGLLFAWDTQTRQSKSFKAELPYNSVLACKDGQLFAVGGNDGIVYTLEFFEDRVQLQKVVQLDWSDMIQGDIGPILYRAVIADSFLYLLMNGDAIPYGRGVTVFDLNTGEKKEFEVENIGDIANYKNNRLLMFTQEFGERGKIGIYDAQSGAMQEILESPAGDYYFGGLAYEAESNTVCILGNGVIYTSSQGKPFEEAGYSAIDPINHVAAAMTPGNQYIALVMDEAVYTYSLGAKLTPLRITGAFILDSSILKAFQEENPDIPVVSAAIDLTDTEALSQQILSHNEDIDLYLLSTGTDLYDAALQKGYFQSLDGSALLQDAASRMYPQCVAALSQNGELLAFPYTLGANILAYHEGLFAQKGLAVPQTLSQFLAFCKEQAVQEDSVLMYEPLGNLSATILRYMVSLYVSGIQAQTGAVTYDTPLFQTLITDWEKYAPLLDATQSSAEISENSETFFEDGEALLAMPSSLLRSEDGWLSAAYRPLTLSLAEDAAPTIPASMGVLVINPASRNLSAAMRFVEFYATHLPRAESIMLYPDDNTPVEAENYNANLARDTESINSLTALLVAAKPEEKKALEDQLAQAQTNLEYTNAHHWQITPEAIATYRQIAGYLAFGSIEMGFDGKYLQISRLMNQFAAQEISSSQFLKELIRIQQAIAMEEQ